MIRGVVMPIQFLQTKLNIPQISNQIIQRHKLSELLNKANGYKLIKEAEIILNQSIEYILSPREMEVLKLLAQGYSNQGICDKLFLALSTVKGFSHMRPRYIHMN